MYVSDKIVARSCRYDREFSLLAIDKIDTVLDRLIANVAGPGPSLENNRALIVRHCEMIESDGKEKIAFAKAYLPILDSDHLIIGNIFSPATYLSEERFHWFKEFLEMSPFGGHKKSVRHALTNAGVDADTLFHRRGEEETSRPSHYVASIIALFFSLFSNAEGEDKAKAGALFERYCEYRDLLFSHCLGMDYGHRPAVPDLSAHDGGADRYLVILDKLIFSFMQSLIEEHRLNVSPFHRLCAIFREKSPYASMHHNNVCMNGVNLAQVFADENFDPVRFSREMIETSWFDKDDPAKSRFFKNLTAFGKPMFGVFSDSELKEIEVGVAAHDGDQTGSHFHENVNLLDSMLEDIERSYRNVPLPPATTKAPYDLRAMYHALINRKFDRTIDNLSLGYIKETIESSRNMDIERYVGKEFIYFHYSKEELYARLNAIYRTQMEAANSVSSVDIDIDTIRSIHFTYAPTAFIDGCWLENVPKIFRYDPNVTLALYNIYYDELGSGEYLYNHARIYEDLLKDLSINLPPAHSIEFARHEFITDGAFRTPVFMLALARHIDDLFPELLGFTLSTELFGLGGFYQYLMNQLQKNKFDTNFYSIHISVDNLSSGHSAMAAKAVVNFMEGAVDLLQSREMTDVLWRRVWDGFMASRYLLK